MTSILTTCNVVEYHLTITNETIAPDGVERLGLLINGQFPGPAIEANWGDTIIVHLTNAMQDNGTSLHFHGMRQFGSNEMDGVPSITQCALAPGDSMTYKFVATNYGTSWYHSHWGLQTFDGVFGPMIIHGPSSKEYDVDAGPIVLSDWNHVSVNEIYDSIQQTTSRPGAPTLDTGLINGKNVWGNGGERFEMEFESGKAYLLRLVNCAIQATFKFSLDGHKFWVVSTDFVPIVPYETDSLTINIGQRYNIIVVADQTPSAYWMRADNQLSCSPITQYDDIKAIVRYKDANQGLVSGLVSNLTSVQGSCADEPAASLVPVVAHTVGPQSDNIHENVLVGPGPSTPNLYKWTLNGATFQSQWGDPTLNHILDNGTVPDYSGQLAIEIPELGEWVYIIIETPIPVPHPIHLHGHDFYVLTSGIGPWTGDTSVFQLNNPPRRDVAMMPGGAGPAGAGGHLVLAFYTDNPGAWLMHCHIGWHAQMGFALQIIENLEGIKKTEVDTCKMQETCKNWHSYTNQANIFTMPDSGI
ncbi:multicopper oxidase [Polychaeton citri CBS 116435]|uniref:Multicopper oxidase n=1 Tax=Polychaeton citri CBS 116435 TaxID=1314669 RepID=A0A9P4PZT1_9PEZI|nr:multicopper oxidase [Polychaeton citri CBS 116435]